MIQTVEAIYENGIFKPLNPIADKIAEKQKVILTFEPKEEINPIMKLAENFYGGLSEEEINEIEAIMLDRSNFFGGRATV